MEYFATIIETTLNSFDFTYCILVNVLAYGLIKSIDDVNGDKPVSPLVKKICTFASIVMITIFYIMTGSDLKLVINSAILAPVSWNWIIKPVFNKLGIDYKKESDVED